MKVGHVLLLEHRLPDAPRLSPPALDPSKRPRIRGCYESEEAALPFFASVPHIRTSSCADRTCRTGYILPARDVHGSPVRGAASYSYFRRTVRSGSSAAWLASRGRYACVPRASAWCRPVRNTRRKQRFSFRIAWDKRNSRHIQTFKKTCGFAVSVRCCCRHLTLLSCPTHPSKTLLMYLRCACNVCFHL